MEDTKINIFEGTGAFNREDSVTFIDVGFQAIDKDGVKYANNHTEEWFALGEDNDELTRERNDETESSKNVLGKTSISQTSGAQTTEIDPHKLRANEKLSYLLYMINKYDLKEDKAKVRGMEVTFADKQGEKTYGAWTEGAVIQLNSWGGDTSAIGTPFVLNWDGDKIHGTFSTETKTFTATTEAN